MEIKLLTTKNNSLGGGVNISLIGEINPEFKGIWFSGTADKTESAIYVHLNGFNNETTKIPIIDGYFEYKEAGKQLTSCNSLFLQWNMYTYDSFNTDCITSIDISKLDFSNISDIDGMFWGCLNLKTISFADLDVSKINTLSSTFYTCSKLENIDMSNFILENVYELTFI